MKYKVPITGFLVIDTDDLAEGERELARWLLHTRSVNPNRRNEISELFPDAKPPIDVFIQVDHSHIFAQSEELLRKSVAETEAYEVKLAKLLFKKEREQVLAELKESEREAPNGKSS